MAVLFLAVASALLFLEHPIRYGVRVWKSRQMHVVNKKHHPINGDVERASSLTHSPAAAKFKTTTFGSSYHADGETS